MCFTTTRSAVWAVSLSHATSLHVFCWLFLFVSCTRASPRLWILSRDFCWMRYTDFCWMFLMLLCLVCPFFTCLLHVLAPSYSGPCACASHCCSAGTMHQHLLDLTVDPPASAESSAPVFTPVHSSRCSAHSARVARLVWVLTPVPLESLTTVVAVRQGLLPLVHETGTCCAFSVFSCVASLLARQRSCPCTVALKLRHSLAHSGCSRQCAAPVELQRSFAPSGWTSQYVALWNFSGLLHVLVVCAIGRCLNWTFWLSRANALVHSPDSVNDRAALDVLPHSSGSPHSTCLFGHTFCNLCLFPEFLNLQWRGWHTVLHCVAANALEGVAVSALESYPSALRHAAPGSAVRGRRCSTLRSVTRTCWIRWVSSPFSFRICGTGTTTLCSTMRSHEIPNASHPCAWHGTCLLRAKILLVVPSNCWRCSGRWKRRWSSPSSQSHHRTARFPPRGHLYKRLPNSPRPSWGKLNLWELRGFSPHSLASRVSSLLLDVNSSGTSPHGRRSKIISSTSASVSFSIKLVVTWSNSSVISADVTINAMKISTIASTTFLFCVRVLQLPGFIVPRTNCICRIFTGVLGTTWTADTYLCAITGIGGLMSMTLSMNCIWGTSTVLLTPTPTSSISRPIAAEDIGGLILCWSSTFHTTTLKFSYYTVSASELIVWTDAVSVSSPDWLLWMSRHSPHSLLHSILINPFAPHLFDLLVRDTLHVKLVVGRALLTDRIVHSTLLVDEVVLSWRSLCRTRRSLLIDRLGS